MISNELKVDKYKAAVNLRLEELVPQVDSKYASLYESMRYSLLSNGKRIRPLLSAAVYEVMDENFFDGIDYACAIEMIHSYSLIHDDLPAMDNDDIRRGKPTNHIVFGEAMAILSGDGLLNQAAEILLRNISASKHESKDPAGAALYIMQAAGSDGMIAGQVLDMRYENEHISKNDLELMHSLKTGRLIEASICHPAILYKRQDLMPILKKISKIAGLSFQIKDDILDVEGDFKKLGKRTGRDDKSKKSTYITLLGLEKARILLEEQRVKVKEQIELLGRNNEFLNFMIDMISTRQA